MFAVDIQCFFSNFQSVTVLNYSREMFWHLPLYTQTPVTLHVLPVYADAILYLPPRGIKWPQFKDLFLPEGNTPLTKFTSQRHPWYLNRIAFEPHLYSFSFSPWVNVKVSPSLVRRTVFLKLVSKTCFLYDFKVWSVLPGKTGFWTGIGHVQARADSWPYTVINKWIEGLPGHSRNMLKERKKTTKTIHLHVYMLIHAL